jgi:hypothetical protein
MTVGVGVASAVAPVADEAVRCACAAPAVEWLVEWCVRPSVTAYAVLAVELLGELLRWRVSAILSAALETSSPVVAKAVEARKLASKCEATWGVGASDAQHRDRKHCLVRD